MPTRRLLSGLWLLTLLMSACSPDPKSGTTPTASVSVAPPPDTTGGLAGRLLYKQNCVRCHGINGDKCMLSARNLQESTLPLAARVALIQAGRGKMPAFSPRLNPTEVEAVARWSRMLYRKPIGGAVVR